MTTESVDLSVETLKHTLGEKLKQKLVKEPVPEVKMNRAQRRLLKRQQAENTK